MTKKGVRISPKHGLNPCIPVCVFCGEEKNDVAILGMLKNDKEAPRNVILDYEPCEKCKANWSMGVPLICVTTNPPVKDMPPLTKQNGTKFYPTGKYHVITPDASKRIFNMDRKCGQPILLDESVFNQFTKDAKEAGAIPKEDKT